MQASDNSVANGFSGTVQAQTRMPGALVVRATNRTTGEVLTVSHGGAFAILGRVPNASVRLDDPSISQIHAYLQLVDGIPYCIDLGSRTGVLWDDGSQGRGWILPDQTVRIGIFDVQITPDEDTTSGSPDHERGPMEVRPPAALDVHSPHAPAGRFSLDLPVTLVGRHPNCNLRFMDEGVPYFQCALVNTRDGLWCINLASQRVTVLNGRPTRVALLHDGDLLETGRTSLVVRVGPDATHPLARVDPTGATVAHMARDPRSGMEATAFEPLRGMMEQFQQCFMMMARMFTTMQQEHTAMMCEQLRQIQELLRETSSARRDQSIPFAEEIPAAPAPPSPRAAPVPNPRPVDSEAAKLLSDAHAWFLTRLNQNGTSPASKPKPK
jgi:hypothetical protein